MLRSGPAWRSGCRSRPSSSRSTTWPGSQAHRGLTRCDAPANTARPYRVLPVDDSWLTGDMFALRTAEFFERPGAMTIDHAEDAEEAWGKLGKSDRKSTR